MDVSNLIGETSIKILKPSCQIADAPRAASVHCATGAEPRAKLLTYVPRAACIHCDTGAGTQRDPDTCYAACCSQPVGVQENITQVYSQDDMGTNHSRVSV